jgi:hypothetical protein
MTSSYIRYIARTGFFYQSSMDIRNGMTGCVVSSVAGKTIHLRDCNLYVSRGTISRSIAYTSNTEVGIFLEGQSQLHIDGHL